MEPRKKIIPIKSAEAASERPEKPSDRKYSPPTAQFIVKYALILLCVAFVLVLLSYLSHQQKQVEQAVSAVQSIETLLKENSQFQEDLDNARQTIDTLNDNLDDARAAGQSARTQLDDTQKDLTRTQAENLELARMAEEQRRAMEYLWRLEYLVSARRYGAARELLAEMRETDAPDFLPDDQMEGMETLELSPAEEFQRLVEILE